MCGGSNPVDDLFSSANDALSDLDDTVGETIPGGWMTAAKLAMMANGVPAGETSNPIYDFGSEAWDGANAVSNVSDANTLSNMSSNPEYDYGDVRAEPPPSLPGDVSQGSNFPGETDDYGQPLNRGPSEGPVTPRGPSEGSNPIYDYGDSSGVSNPIYDYGDVRAEGGIPFSLSNLGNSALGGVKSVGNWAMKNPIPAMYAGGSLYDMYAKNKMAKKQEGIYNQNRADIMNAYAPGSPEYEQMAQAMARKDAAAGRNSQYGTRANDLAATLAKMRMNSLTSLQGSQNTLANQSISNQYGMFNTPLALAMYSQRPRSRATPIEDTSY